MAQVSLTTEEIIPDPPTLWQAMEDENSGIPKIQLEPTGGVISIGDIVINSFLSAIVTVLLFRVVFGGSPQELVQNVAEQFPRGVVAEEMQQM